MSTAIPEAVTQVTPKPTTAPTESQPLSTVPTQTALAICQPAQVSGTIAKLPSLPPITSGVMIRSGLKIIATDRRYDPPPGCCFNFSNRGHTARECPRANQGSFCRNCGRVKTTIDHCPRCLEAHWAYRLQRYQGHGDFGTKITAYQKSAPEAT